MVFLSVGEERGDLRRPGQVHGHESVSGLRCWERVVVHVSHETVDIENPGLVWVPFSSICRVCLKSLRTIQYPVILNEELKRSLCRKRWTHGETSTSPGEVRP